MYVDELNAKGGVLGRKIELLTRDSKARRQRGGARRPRADPQGERGLPGGHADLRGGPGRLRGGQGEQDRLHRADPEDRPAHRRRQAPPLRLPRGRQHHHGGAQRGRDRGQVAGDQDRHHRLRLRLRPGRDQGLRRPHEEDQAERADRGPAVAEARRAGLQPVHQRPDGQEAGGGGVVASGAASSSPSPSRPRPLGYFDAVKYNFIGARRGGLARRRPSRWARTTRWASGATPTTPSTGARPPAHRDYTARLSKYTQGRVPVVVGHPGLHRHAVPRRGHQEGQQHGLRQGLQGAARPHHRHADRQADDPREGPPGQPRPALRQDGEGSEVSRSRS